MEHMQLPTTLIAFQRFQHLPSLKLTQTNAASRLFNILAFFISNSNNTLLKVTSNLSLSNHIIHVALDPQAILQLYDQAMQVNSILFPSACPSATVPKAKLNCSWAGYESFNILDMSALAVYSKLTQFNHKSQRVEGYLNSGEDHHDHHGLVYSVETGWFGCAH